MNRYWILELKLPHRKYGWAFHSVFLSSDAARVGEVIAVALTGCTESRVRVFECVEPKRRKRNG